MKLVGENAITKLIQLVKSTFIKNTDVVATNTVDVDTVPTESSNNLITSGGVYDALVNKENKHTVNYAVLLAASWTASGAEYTQTVSGNYISTDNDYIVDAPPTYESVYGYNGIKAVSMTNGTMTFTAKSLPTVDIQIRITNWG